jgi:serine/threonine-protein kinase
LQAAALIEGDPYVGTVFASNYVVEEKIGEGGMGVVYRVKTLDVGRTLALKMLHERFTGNPSAVKRFEREAKVASRLNHPNTISILDFGHTTAGLSYLVMEFLHGKGLGQLLAKETFHLARSIHIMRQILSALEAAHALGIVHRDLKPGNIFLLSNTSVPDHVKVLDFGIAHSRRADDIERVTRTGMVCGTPEYMSPEQARGHETDARSDIYTAGVVFYELITGRRPFEGQSPAEIMAAQIHQSPLPPSQRNPQRNIPPSLDAIVLWALAKKPDDRFPSAREFHRVLDEWIQVSEKWLRINPPPVCPECGAPMETDAKKQRCPGCGYITASEQSAAADSYTLSSADILHAASKTERPTSAGAAAGGQSATSAATIDTAFRLRHNVPTYSQSEIPVWICPAPSDCPFVGRKSLMLFLEESVAEGGFQVFLFSGASGLGKHRTAEELLARAASEGRKPLRAPTPSWAISEPLEPIRNIAVELLELPCEPVDPEDLADGLKKMHLPVDLLAGLCSVFGFAGGAGNGASQPRRQSMAEKRLARADAWRQLVVACAHRQPIVMLFPNLELLDGASKELILALAATDSTAPLTLLLTHAENYFALWPERCRTIEVEPLNRPEAQKLAYALAHDNLSGARIEQAVDEAAGNPLHLREQIAFYCLHANDTPPQKLPDLIAARVNRLPPDARQRLQALAIISRVVKKDVLTGLESLEGTPLPEIAESVEKSIQILEHTGFITKGPPKELIHELHRRVVTSSIPAAVKSELHRRAARVVGQQGGTAFPVAHHQWHSNRPDTALPHLLAAGQNALDALDEEDAEFLFRRVLEALKGPDSTLAATHGSNWIAAVGGLAQALQRMGQQHEAKDLIAAACRRAERIEWHAAKERLLAFFEGEDKKDQKP